MTEQPEKIQGKNIFDILQQAKIDRTLINLHLTGSKYENLTVITDIRVKNNNPFFSIDYTKGFKEAVVDLDACKLKFKFIGKDNIHYKFSTSGAQISHNNNKIWIKFPGAIERMQRRKNFRIDAPISTIIFYKENSTEHKINVTNISAGGAHGAVAYVDNKTQKELAWEAGKILRDLELVFQSKKNATVYIKEASVIRLHKHTQKKQYNFAINFSDISQNEKNILIELIYKFQRESLRKRVPYK